MVKLEWGSKRACQSCQAKFYDLQRTPITCPKCGSIYEIAVTTRKGRKAAVHEDEDLKLQGLVGEEVGLDDVDLDVDLVDGDDLIHDEEDLDHDLDDVADVLINDDDEHH